MDSSTLLFRQVHPLFIQQGTVSEQVFNIGANAPEVTSQVFKPTPKDDKKLSVYNSEKFTAEESYVHYIGNGYQSSGVLGVTGQECDELSLSYLEDNDPFDGHTYIDFNPLGDSDMKKKAKKLRNMAMERGWLHLDIY